MFQFGTVDSQVQAPPVLTVAYTDGGFSTTNKTDYSGDFDGKAIGPASSDREVVLTLGASQAGSSDAGASTVTIGGVSATRIKKVAFPGAIGFVTEAWKALVPTGTTADIDIVFTNTIDVMAFDLFALVGENTFTTGDTVVNGENVSMTVPAGGAIIGATSGNGSAGITWSANITEDTDTDTGASFALSSASAEKATEITENFSATWTSPGSRLQTIFLAFGPVI